MHNLQCNEHRFRPMSDQFSSRIISSNGRPALKALMVPGSLNFGDVIVGTESAKQVVTLLNEGYLPLQISAIRWVGDFHVTTDAPANGELPVNGYCSFTVTYLPTAEGNSSGALYVDTLNTEGNTFITLQGRGVDSMSGPGGGGGSFIPWVYNGGSANGGELTLTVTENTVGVPELFINGLHQEVGLGFTFDPDTAAITLADQLEEGDEVIAHLSGVPANPDNPNIDNWHVVNWLYNEGSAIGGEQVLVIPYTFQTVVAVFKNGLRYVANLLDESFSFSTSAQSVTLTEALVPGDRVVVQIGGEFSVIEMSDRTLYEVARSANVPDSAVILSNDQITTLNGKTTIYDVVAKKIWGIPSGIPSGATVGTVSGSVLNYSPGNVPVNLSPFFDDSLIGLVQPFTGSVVRSQHQKNGELLSIKDFGAIGDGTLHLLSSYFSTLAAAQAVYPFVTSLSQSVDWAAAQAAANSRFKCAVPKGVYFITDTIVMPVGACLIGSGTDYWDTYRPSVGRLNKSWDYGSHFVMVGEGAKNQAVGNISNTLVPKTDSSGRIYAFTKLTNEDSVNGSPATARLFSCGVKMTHNSTFCGIRVMINFNGIAGYNDSTTLELGDNWDVGIWVYDGNESRLDTVQVVGYWRMAALMITENGGTWEYKGNPESLICRNVYTQGVRGCLIRNSPEVDVVSINSTSSITVKYNSSFTLTSAMKFTLIGGATIYTATGYTVASGNLTFTGVTPALPASASAMRSPVQGNNFSGTVFENCKFNALDHTSGTDSFTLGLGQAFSLEGDGYPCRNLRFVGTKMQTVFDHGNTLLGDARDWKFVASAFENGAMVAYSNSGGSVNFTGNIRMDSATEIAGTLDTTLFDPRDCHIGYLEEPTQFSDGTKVIKHWRAKNIELQYFSGSYGMILRESDKNLQLQNGNGFMFARSAGSTNGLDLWGSNVTLNGSDGLPIVQLFGTSKNANFLSNTTAVNSVVVTAVRGSVAGVATCGTTAFPWATGYTNVAFTVTSDMRDKQDISAIPDNVLDAWGNVDWQIYRLKSDVEKDANADFQAGLMAQEIMSAFITAGVDATKYGVIVYSKWDEQTDPETGIATPAGERYGVNYTHANAIEAAYQRRELAKLQSIIDQLSK